MKHFSRILFFSAVLALLLAACAVSAAAVPALPGHGPSGEAAVCHSHSAPLLPPEAVAAHPANAYGSKAPALDPAENDLPLAVIVIGFDNIAYDETYDWGKDIFEGDRSLQSFYSDMSLGKFTFVPVAESSAAGVNGNTNLADAENDGVIHVKVSTEHRDWSLTKETSAVYRPLMDAFGEALLQAAEVMDFAAYDANGDGKITTDELAVAFIVAGYEAAASDGFPMGRELYLWSHAWSIEEAIKNFRWKINPPAPDGVRVSSYISIAEQLDETTQEPICVLAHELGHYLGLEDFYDTTYSQRGEWSGYAVDMTSVMSNAWGQDADGNYLPPAMDAYNRWLLHWYTPQTADAAGTFTVAAQDYASETPAFSALLIPTRRDGEFYLIENRQPTKWDTALPERYAGASATSGLLIWHVDETYYDLYAESNLINASIHHPTLMPLFPEDTRDGVALIGTGYVACEAPFWTAAEWARVADADGRAELPIYGQGLRADRRSGRQVSGLQLRILSDSAAEMQVELQTVAHDYCPYCGELHGSSFGERITAFFHNLFYRIRSLFVRPQAALLPEKQRLPQI